jgi:hypothetical protein
LAWKVLGAARTRAGDEPWGPAFADTVGRGDPIEGIERTAFKGAPSATAPIAVVIDQPQSAVADFLNSAAVGPSGLVVEGEAGIGKTTRLRPARRTHSSGSQTKVADSGGHLDHT